MIELIMVVMMVVMMSLIMVSILNATGVIKKSRDARRKNDIRRIKIAFEEYFNDKGCYPDNTVVSGLTLKSNCQSRIFSPWLNSWPCDPLGATYQIVVEAGTCPKQYRILTQLENLTDSSIPADWPAKIASGTYSLGGSSTAASANFGVSSDNILWSEKVMNPACVGGCFFKPDPIDMPNVCASAGTGCVGPNCYTGTCQAICAASCCGVGCN